VEQVGRLCSKEFGPFFGLLLGVCLGPESTFRLFESGQVVVEAELSTRIERTHVAHFPKNRPFGSPCAVELPKDPGNA
jgi:hypothetical protein